MDLFLRFSRNFDFCTINCSRAFVCANKTQNKANKKQNEEKQQQQNIARYTVEVREERWCMNEKWNRHSNKVIQNHSKMMIKKKKALILCTCAVRSHKHTLKRINILIHTTRRYTKQIPNQQIPNESVENERKKQQQQQQQSIEIMNVHQFDPFLSIITLTIMVHARTQTQAWAQ